jgi:hypothetical protein
VGIGPVFGVLDALANPRRTEGITAPRFHVKEAAAAGQDRPSQRQFSADRSLDDDLGEGLGLEPEAEEAAELSADPLRSGRIDFIA